MVSNDFEMQALELLASLGVDDEYKISGQILVPSSSIGMGIEDFETKSRWLVLDVPHS